MDTFFKKRILGAGILLVLLAIWLPAFLDGSGQVLTDFESDIPQPPTNLQEALDRQIALQNEPTTTPLDTQKNKHITRQLEVPELVDDTPKLPERSQPSEKAKTVTEPPTETPKKKPANQPSQQDAIAQLLERKGKQWAVQVGAFSNQQNANKLVAQLKKDNYNVFTQTRTIRQKKVLVVFLGPILSREKAEAWRSDVSRIHNLKAIVTLYSSLGQQ